MPISTTCPHCAAGGTFPDAEAGKSVTCASCGGAIDLPAKARPVAAAIVAQAKPVAAKPVAKPSATPKSKSEFSFDDDADDASKKKKSRHRDDEDEEDERPRRKPAPKKGGAGKILLILGGIAFVLFAGCAGAGYYFYIKVDKAVTDIQSKMTFPSVPEGPETKETKSTKPTAKPTLKQNVQTFTRGDSFTTVSTKMGSLPGARVSDLEQIFSTFEVGKGRQTKANLQIVLDAYAPWVDAGRGILLSDGTSFRALIVFSGVGTMKQEWKVYGVLTIEQTPNGTQYNEQVGLAKVTYGDPEAQKLNLKGWKNFRIDDGTDGVPTETTKISAVDLAAEVFRDRTNAAKKYAGVTLEITGEVTSKSAKGMQLTLKGGTDEKTGKPLLIVVAMKPAQQDAAERCELGSTITVYGLLQGRVPPGSGSIPIKEASIKQ